MVLDLFSRKVVGWHLSDSPDTALILAALNQAVVLRQVSVSNGVLFHSDQGCQYTSHAYQNRLTELGIKASMSRRSNCWDNAVMERFFRSLKVESISLDRYQTAEELAWAVKNTSTSTTPNGMRRIYYKIAGMPNGGRERYHGQGADSAMLSDCPMPQLIFDCRMSANV